MDRSGGRPKDIDIWEHVTELEGKRVKCKYCGLVFAASANRIKSHVYQIKGNGIRLCTRFPPPSSIGSNERVIRDLKENLLDSQGLSTLGRARDYNKLNETMLDCYVSPKAMWEGIMARPQLNVEIQNQEKINVGPFLVSNKLNASDLQLIQYVFDLSPDECGACPVFSSSCSFLNLSEFITLKPQTQLDSLVIDIFAEILTDIERKNKTTPSKWYLPVTFSMAALSGDISSFLNFVEKQNIREKYMSDFLDCKKMFIPVHAGKNSHGHFYLYIIDVKNQVVQIWDSLSDQFINEKERDVTTQKLLLALDALFANDKRVTDLAFTKFYRRKANNILSQPNGYDCGVFVINFMQRSANFVKKNPLFEFHSEEERLDLVLKLLKSSLNKERERLYGKADERHYAQGGNEQNSDLRGIKRKHVDIWKTSFENVRGRAYIELDDSDRRVRGNVGVEKGYARGYILPTTRVVGKQFLSYIEQIWKWLMVDEASVIGVWGMEGVGKTTLVTHIHNKLLEDNGDFDQVIWVTVSQHHSTSQMQKVIAKSINLDISDEYEAKRIAGKLLHTFKHMNKCVIILDDVGDHIFLEDIGFPTLRDGFKLILTTRLRGVCQSMDCTNIIKVKPLDLVGSWNLFESTLGIHHKLSCEVEEIARSLTLECGGLPRAIVTMARSMKGKEDMRYWNHILTKMPANNKWKEDLQKVFLTGKDIIKIPDGTSLRCSQLLTLFLDNNCYLQLIPDDFFINMPTLRFLNLSYTSISYLPTSVSNLECLVALWLAGCRFLRYVPSVAKLQQLRSLVLCHTAIIEVPPGLELLMNLKCLDLRGTKDLKMSTSSIIPKLTNLQSLYLNSVSKSMDVKAQDLQGLKELEVISTNFCDINEFNAYVRSGVPENYWFTVNKTEACFDDIYQFSRGQDTRKTITFAGSGFGDAAPILPQDIQRLYMFECHGLMGILCSSLSFHKDDNPCKIEWLELSRCNQLYYLFCFSSICRCCSSVQLVNGLRLINLNDLKALGSPAPSWHLHTVFFHLRDLTIERCNSMRTLVTWELLVHLQNLETLFMEDCESLEEIFSKGRHSEHTITLPKLSSVRLANLPCLSFLYRGIMLCPCIKHLTIKNCERLIFPPQIKKIPDGVALQIFRTSDGCAFREN